MRRIIMMISAFSLLISGCDKKEMMPESTIQGDIAVTLKAGYGAATKTGIDGKTAVWELGDQLGVFVNAGTGNSNQPFTLDPLDAGKTAGQFLGALNAFTNGTLYAYYPYSASAGTRTAVPVSMVENGVQYFNGKAAQEGETPGDFDAFGKYSYMVAAPVTGLELSENKSSVISPVLDFKHVTAVLDLVLTASADMTISSVEMSTVGESFVASGDLDITAFGEEQRLTVNNVVKTGKLTLKFGTSAAETTLALKAGQAQTVRMVMLPVNLEGISVTFSVTGKVGASADDVTLTMVKPGKNIQRGVCYTTPVNISVAVSPQAAEQAFNDGASAVVITAPVTNDATIQLPPVASPADQTALSLTASINSGATLALKAPDSGEAPANLSVTNSSTEAPASAGNVAISLPASTVNMAGNFGEVTASTAENTLIVEENCTINKLIVTKGNVKIYGTVNEVDQSQSPGSQIIEYAKDAADLLNKIKANEEDSNGGAVIALITGKVYDLSTASGNITITKPLTITSDNANNPVQLVMGENSIVSSAGIRLENIQLTGNTPKGKGLVHAEGNQMSIWLNNCRLEQQTAGTTDGVATTGIAVHMAGQENVLTLTGTVIYIPKNYQRGINVDGQNTYTMVTMTDSKITTDNISVPKTYSRGVNIYNTKGADASVVTLDHSIVEGVYYAVNVPTGNNLQVDVKNNSVLDGRAGLNIWDKGVYNLTNSTVKGRNIYQGPTERFAGIVLDNSNMSASGSIINIQNSTIGSFRDPVTPNNGQYAFSIRVPDVTVNFTGNNIFIDESSTIPCFIQEQYLTGINGKETIQLQTGRTDAIACARGSKWNGTDMHEPDNYVYQGVHYYEFYTAAELAWLADQISKGVTFAKKMMDIYNDIDMNNNSWSALKKLSNVTLNGNGYSISNFQTIQQEHAGFIGDAITVTIKNLTLKNVSIKSEEVNKGDQNAYAGGFIGRCYGAVLVENCVLENSTVEGINKVGGMVGFNAENGLTIKDCIVKGSTVKTDDTQPEHGQCGGVLGYVGNVYGGTTSITGTYVIDTKVEAALNTTQTYRHVGIYVGSFQGSANDKLTITAPENAIQNSTLNAQSPDVSAYQGLLGGVRYTTTLSATTELTINGTRYTE